MKPQHQKAIAKLSHGARELLFFMSTKKPMVAVVLTVMAKCRGLWEGLTGCGAAAHSSADDDYFRWSYEFSCTTTPVGPVRGCGSQAREMLASSVAGVAPTEGFSPECSPEAGVGNEIDGLAEEFINRFHEQLRQQMVAELQVMERKKTSPSPLVRRAPANAQV